MSDVKFDKDGKPVTEKVIGRLNNEIDPNYDPATAPAQKEIGVVNNEIDPDFVQEDNPPKPVIGTTSNELNPVPGESIPLTEKPVGMVNNEKEENEEPTKPAVDQS
jgi:hypothetical protein